jgi:uncharacterized membrane protein (DUF373 family)
MSRAIHGRVWLRLLGWLEQAQDVVLFGLALGLFVLMSWQLVAMWRHLRAGVDVRAVLTDILYVLILVELFRVVMHYLGERHVAVGTMVEIAMINVLREIMLRGPLEAPWPQLLVATALLAVLGLLYRFAGFHLGAGGQAGSDVPVPGDPTPRI